MKKWLVLCCVVVAGMAESKHYIVHHASHNESGYVHMLSQWHPVTQKLTHKTIIGEAKKDLSYVLYSTSQQQIITYLPANNNRSSQLVFFEFSTLKEIRRIDVPQILTDSNHMMATTPLFLSADQNNVVLLSNQSDLSLHIFNIVDGKTLLSRQLNNKQSLLKVTDDNVYFYAKNVHGNGRNLTIIDLNAAKTTGVVNLGKLDVNTHMHDGFMWVSMEQQSNRRPTFGLHQIDFKNGKKIKTDVPASEYHFVFVRAANGSSYVAGKNVKGKRDLFIAEINKSAVSEPVYQGKKVAPRALSISGDGQTLMVIGEDKLAVVGTTDMSLRSRFRLPFDSFYGVVNEAGTLGIVQEGSGSEIGFVDLVEGDVKKQIGAGRTLVKIGKISPGYLIGGLVLGGAASHIISHYSEKKLQFNHDESRALVINGISNDITFIDAENYKKMDAISTGNDALLMLQFPALPDIVLTMNQMQINIFDAQKAEELLELNSIRLVGVDTESAVVFYQENNQLKQLDLKDLTAPTTVSEITALGVYVF
ncbi:hypothetical protein OS175_04300 [Marinicella sp. S1101]|uniref:hypothetical protein n=1 Tax=Marinicella marina TaxID=2996016 RepID=UPI002260CCBD|nr:hypothetical protein [Marinicella marina]MCX7553088.1 hypothetical protein [Marinicella marina]MDJ1138820.1 hypothetical protein [Marinicella marina]